MVFYVYADPEIISIAKEGGQNTLQILVAILRDFVDNCFITEFEDYRVQAAIERNVNEIPDRYFERKQIKTLLATLQKRNRFIYCFTPDYSGVRSDLNVVLENSTENLVDLILIGEINPEIECPDNSEISDLSNYQNTNFAENRSRAMRDGGVFAGGELNEQEFMNSIYQKAFKYAGRLEIYDAIFGRHFADNFDYTTRQFLRWLGNIHATPKNFRIIFHCEKPEGMRDEHIKNRLTRYKQDFLTNTEVEIIFYETTDGSQCLPHDRYFITDQIAFQIGRGMDFLDRNTHKNRDTSINIKNPSTVEKALEKYNENRLPPILI